MAENCLFFYVCPTCPTCPTHFIELPVNGRIGGGEITSHHLQKVWGTWGTVGHPKKTQD
jgi:hypothetical protein